MDEIDEIQVQLRKADLDSIGSAFQRIAEQAWLRIYAQAN
jgi:hypothetical protein